MSAKPSLGSIARRSGRSTFDVGPPTSDRWPLTFFCLPAGTVTPLMTASRPSMNVSDEKNGFTFKAYAGDARTLLAFNLTQAKTKDLAGFTIQIQPGTEQSY